MNENELTIRTLIDTAAQGIIAVDIQGRIRIANRMLETMFGYAPGELLGKPHEVLIPEGARSGHQAHRLAYWKQPRTGAMGEGLDLLARRKDGSEFPVEVSLSYVLTGEGGLAVGFVTDATARKQAEAALRFSEHKLRALTASLLTAQEDERRRLARELHDDVTQRLALLSMEVAALAGTLTQSADGTQARLRSIKERLQQLSCDVRRAAHGLHPSMLEDLGLSPALEALCSEFAAVHDLRIEFSAKPPDTGLSASVAATLYRVAQESIRNAAKYAEASCICVELRQTRNALELRVSDDGVGFTLEPNAASNGLGIISMKERLRLVGGTLSVHSSPGEGTTVTACVPL